MNIKDIKAAEGATTKGHKHYTKYIFSKYSGNKV